MTELHDFERQVRAELLRTVESVNPPQGAAERAIAAARAGAESQHLRQQRVRHWILPLAAAAAAVVLVAGVALVSHSSLDDSPAGPSPSPQPSLTSTPEPSVSPSPSVTPTPSVPGTGAAVAPSPTSTRPVPATKKVVIRPVDQTGRPAPGYTVTDLTKGANSKLDVNCGTGPDPLRYSSTTGFPAAVDASIMLCSPTAPSVAFACWEAAAPGHALCLQDPWSRQLVEWTAGFTSTTKTATAPDQPQPLGLLLSDGEHCLMQYRDFAGRPAQQPTMLSPYLCGTVDANGLRPGAGAIWAPGNNGLNTPWEDLVTRGIDRSTPMWTVQVSSGQGPLSIRRVIAAYYVGTKGT